MAEPGRGVSAQNPIACELCRSRKRKCDRSLPHCLQCSQDPSQCHYSEQNKRGLLPGYVSKLESRLAETEKALFHVLQRVQGDEFMSDTFNATPIASMPITSQPKSDRLKEWERLPLRAAGELQAWYAWKQSGQDGAPVPPITEDIDIASLPEVTVQSTSGQWPGQGAQGPVDHGQGTPGSVSTGRSDTSTAEFTSRAKELSKAQRSIYF